MEINAKRPIEVDMKEAPNRWEIAGLLVMTVAWWGTIGCGRGEYDKRLGQRIDELRVRATAAPADVEKADNADASKDQSAEAEEAPSEETADATAEAPAEDAPVEDSSESPETDGATEDAANPFQENSDNENPSDSSE